MTIHQFPPPAPRGEVVLDLAMLELLPAGRRYLNRSRAWEAAAVAGLVRLDADDDLIELVRSVATALRERLVATD